MSETITLSNGNTVETGPWLGGWHGWTNSYSVVDIAVHHGMVLDPEDAAVVEWYRNSGESDSDASDDELDKLEGMTGQGGITDRATEYLEELLPAGWTLRWDDGLTLLRDYMDCAADGNGCDIETTTVDGSYGEIVTLCPDHRPERKIRVVPKVLSEDFATYAVMLWDEAGEVMSGASEVTFRPPVPGLLPSGEFWYPEQIEDPAIRESAEKLLGRSFPAVPLSVNVNSEVTK